jgi:hypothetical protein
MLAMSIMCVCMQFNISYVHHVYGCSLTLAMSIMCVWLQFNVGCVHHVTMDAV